MEPASCHVWSQSPLLFLSWRFRVQFRVLMHCSTLKALDDLSFIHIELLFLLLAFFACLQHWYYTYANPSRFGHGMQFGFPSRHCTWFQKTDMLIVLCWSLGKGGFWLNNRPFLAPGEQWSNVLKSVHYLHVVVMPSGGKHLKILRTKILLSFDHLSRKGWCCCFADKKTKKWGLNFGTK